MSKQHRDQSLAVSEPSEGSLFATRLTSYSITKELAGTTVFVTGGTGYIGSLVVEQLLRTVPDVGQIYLLIRSKRGCSAQSRLDRLLSSGLFNMVRDDVSLCSKVKLLEGDMDSDDLGLSQIDLKTVLRETNIVIHSAASIGLEADVQLSLRSNYIGTKRLLALASKMRDLRCFLHVSTAYVNVNFCKGSSVDEVLYPLMIGRQEAQHADIVNDLMSLEPDSANTRAQMYLDMWNFPNTYTLGKHLTEKLVASYHRNGMPTAIVRPSLVCGLAGDPYPGYCGNLAGPVGMGVAMAIGLFNGLGSVAMVPTHVWDAVPGDVVSSVVLAAAAATAAGVGIKEYRLEEPESLRDPLIVHAGTSTTYPISMIEAAYISSDFIALNPPPFSLPGTRQFRIPIDYVPDEEKVKKAKRRTQWKVSFATRFLDIVGQHKTSHRLKYGYLAWDIMNSTKTDKNMFFSSKNLLKLEELLDPQDVVSGHYRITWTLKNGGWPRYIATNLAGMYRNVFGINNVKGLQGNDFKFIPHKPVAAVKAGTMNGSHTEIVRAASKPETQPRKLFGCLPLLKPHLHTPRDTKPAHNAATNSINSMSSSSSSTSTSTEAVAPPMTRVKLSAAESPLQDPRKATQTSVGTEQNGSVTGFEQASKVQQQHIQMSLPQSLRPIQCRVGDMAVGA